MKISLGMNLQRGPWGGGNQFGHSLVHYLKEKGVEICFDLEQPDLDLIVLVEPRSKLQISAYTDQEIKAYLLQKQWQTLVVHRINECDERKGTTYVNQQLIEANACADHTVFIIVRAESGPPMPLVAVRKRVADLPLVLRIDDSQVMADGVSLTDFPALSIEARLSKSGGVRLQSGDMMGQLSPVTLPSEQQLSIIIDKEV